MFKIKDSSDWGLKGKIVFTLFMLLIYRIGALIPLPFINSSVFEAALRDTTFGNGVLSAMTMVGGSLSELGVFSLGVMPYITASIIFQLLKVASPRLKEMSENATERQKITQWTRYLSVLLALIQSIGIILAAPSLVGVNIFTNNSTMSKLLAIFIMTVGSLIVMRIGEEITAKGVSNGMSLVIFTSILVTIPALVLNAEVSKGLIGMFGFILILFVILGIVSFVEKSEYRIPVVYAKTSMRRVSDVSKLPIKVAIAGVLPVIFASSLMFIPTVISSVFKNDFLQTLSNLIPRGSIQYGIIFSILTLGMTLFSVIIVFDPKQVASEIKNQGGFIAGKRPGRETEDYLSYIANKMAGLDAVYLITISLMSLYLFPLTGVPEGAFGATSLIILSTVVVTLLTVIETEQKTNNLKYSSILSNADEKKQKKGFLR